jgi:hypothetical protein
MPRIYTQKQLISKLKELKQIKPTNEWVSLSKMNILGSDVSVYKEVLQPARQATFSNIFSSIFQRKLAYAFAVLLLMFVGTVGVLKYETSNTAKVAGNLQSDAVAQNTLKSNLEDFKVKSQNLATALKDNSENSTVAIKEVKDAASKLTSELQKNPELAKTIALDINNNKSLLDIPGGNDTPQVVNIYEELDKQLIEDLKKVSKTKDQQDEFDRIEKSYNEGLDYATVLRDLLLMNAISTNTENKDSK